MAKKAKSTKRKSKYDEVFKIDVPFEEAIKRLSNQPPKKKILKKRGEK